MLGYHVSLRATICRGPGSILSLKAVKMLASLRRTAFQLSTLRSILPKECFGLSLFVGILFDALSLDCCGGM